MERYRKIAGDAFKYDLDIPITDLKTGNTEEALQRFDERVNIPQLSTFISGVIGTSKSVDQETFFYLMEQDMKILARENIKREIAKRPGKIKKATVKITVMSSESAFGVSITPMIILTFLSTVAINLKKKAEYTIWTKA